MINDARNKLTTLSQISEETISFFQNLLGTVDSQVVGCLRNILEEVLEDALLPNKASNLCRPVTPEEIKSTIFGIGNAKAPGPDGYSFYFFKAARRVVREDVIVAVLHFFIVEVCLQFSIPLESP